MHRSLFIASPKPLDTDGWNDLLEWEDYEIAEAIYDADYADLITNRNINANDLKFFEYLTIEAKDENNLFVTISDKNRQRCQNWKSEVYHAYSNDIAAGKRYTQNWLTIDAIENDADFFIPDNDCLGIYSEYSSDLPDKFYICRKMYYDYHI